jgi:hypothetical protein
MCQQQKQLLKKILIQWFEVVLEKSQLLEDKPPRR